MNILVIGGTRYMGRHLVTELLLHSHRIFIANRGNNHDDFNNDVQRIIFDRSNEESIKANLSHLTFDIIFDNLAYCSNDIKILLDHVRCKHYIMISTTAVYHKHMDTKEHEFNPLAESVIWCERVGFPYDEAKRQAERALAQIYKDINYTAVRFPFVIGKDDYTNRLYFYVENIIRERPLRIDNFESQMSFIRSDEAGKFLVYFAEKNFYGFINGASTGTISIKQVAEYVKNKTGKEIILSDNGENAPYNGENEYSINIDTAQEIGYSFTPLHDWIYELLDYYIAMALS